MSGIYIHIPFCEKFCTYCSFFSTKGLKNKDIFLQAIKQEISLKRACNLIDKECRTLYIGGGTPSYFGLDGLTQILNTLRKEFDLSQLEEFTVELNPNDVNTQMAIGLKDMGVNRVSMGIQSFYDEHLVWMNRRHNSAQALAAYDLLRHEGFNNLSIDLIFGFGTLTLPQWEENLKTALSLAPEHISAYQMSIEPSSKLGKMYDNGTYTHPSEDFCAAQYGILQKYLSERGYLQYEVSNFSKKQGLESKHNSSYWKGIPYLGFGPGAHSYYLSIRSWNKATLKKYCDFYLRQSFSTYKDLDYKNILDNTVTSGISECEYLSKQDEFNERIMLGLRTCQGININSLETEFPHYFKEIAPRVSNLLNEHKIASDSKQIYIPKDKLFISDSIIRELFIV